jgi:hypothetical protein
MDFAQDEGPALVRKALLEKLRAGYQKDLDEGGVDRLWQGRVAAGAKRHQASFGLGTWLLGEERARKGLDPEKKEEQSGKTPEQRELEERTRRYLENLERQRRAAAGGDQEVSPEEWWKAASPSERFQWLLAYYAEFSGDFDVTSLEFDPCPTCGGTGVIETIETGAQGSQNRRMKCAICHGVGVRRALSFR